jgi:hypothetical protein
VTADPVLAAVHDEWSTFELTSGGSVVPLDPRPLCGGSAFTGTIDPSPNGDSFYDTVTYKGAFGTSNWLDGWSIVNLHGGFVSSTYTCPDTANNQPYNLCGDLASYTLTADMTLQPGPLYILSCQLFVPAGITLSIAPGITIYATPTAVGGNAPALIVERDGTLIADGTAAAPITFTALNPEVSSSAVHTTDTSASTQGVLETRGKWGGLILLGNAPTSAATPKVIEGITGKTYGGSNPTDSSGILRYVRAWHGGAVVGADNEINGITFGGVGSGTVVDHCEVAFNKDDGFEFFGGTVNVKYLSVLFVGDDAFDSDEGYQGKGQFLFAMTGAQGNHGTEMDSKTNGNFDSMPRSHPAFYSMTIIAGGASSVGPSDAVMRLREGTGGKFGNLILSNLGGTHKGIEIKDCGSQSIVQAMPSSSTSIGVSGDSASSGYLFVSPNVAIGSPLGGSAITIASGCSATPSTFAFSEVELLPSSSSITETGGDAVDPRPACGSAAYSGVDALPASSFFTSVGFRGAFGNEIWLDGWSYLDTNATGYRFSSSNAGCGSAGDIAAPATSLNLNCGPNTVANNVTGQCEIFCDASGRRLEEDIALDALSAPVQPSEYLVSLPEDNQSSYASSIVSSYLTKHPELAAVMAEGGMDTEGLISHLEKLGQLFGQPALR